MLLDVAILSPPSRLPLAIVEHLTVPKVGDLFPALFEDALYFAFVQGGPEAGSGLSFSFRGRGFGPDPGGGIFILLLIWTLSTAAY